MKEIPILFSTPMVAALLDKRKTMTRRLVKWPKVPDWHDWDYDANTVERPKLGTWWPVFNHKGFNKDITGPVKCPYGQPGDLIWVRETWAPYLRGTEDNGFIELIKYKADGMELAFKHVKDYSELGWHNRPGIHMNKEYARIWLQVTDIRVERLQDITEEDAKAEGVEPGPFGYKNYDTADETEFEFAKDSFESLWVSINGPESWAANPFVWVVSFKVLSTTGKLSLITEKIER